MAGLRVGDRTPDPNATLLQAGMLMPSSAFGPSRTSPAGSAALANFLNAQYDSGAGASNYVFLRLNNDAAMNNNIRYVFTSADGAMSVNGGSGDIGVWPKMQIALASWAVDDTFAWSVERKSHPTQAGEVLDIKQGNRLVAQFVLEGDLPAKPHLNLYGTDGEILTQDEPTAQFPHHRGVFVGWDEIDSALGSHDLWHMDTGRMITAEVEKVVIREHGVD